MHANQIEKLKALALAADCEEWMTSDGDATVYGEDGDSVCVCHTNIGKMPDPVFAVDRAKFIAEANPAAVLELIAEVERLRAAPAAGTVEKDAERREAWLIANHRWSVRWRIHTKKQIEQWQMADDGEPWGQWGEYRNVVDAAIAAHTKAGKANA